MKNSLLKPHSFFLLVLLFAVADPLVQRSFANETDEQPYLISNTPIILHSHKPPLGADQCVDCHVRKDRPVFPRAGKPSKEHGQISNLHGKKKVSCHNCHDPNKSNLLKSPEDFKADFSNSSPVCSTCHAIIFNEWRNGLHGKRVSGQNGGREQLHCIECHEAHSVKFKKMTADPPPARSKFLVIEKHEGNHAEKHEGQHSDSVGE